MIDFTDDKVSGPITRPWHVVKIKLGQQTVTLSTGSEADWDGVAYKQGRIADGGFTVDDTALTIRLLNEDFAMTAPALRGDYQGGRVEAWYTPKVMNEQPRYLPEGYAQPGYEEQGEEIVPRKVFDGTISEVNEIGSVIGLVAARQRLGGFPSVRIAPPLVNHTAVNGTKLTFNNTIYIVERR